MVLKKQERLALSKQALSEEELKTKVKTLTPTRPFREVISKPRSISLIAEIKKASPSQGVIRQDFNLLEIARAYQEAGAQAISVLTEEDYFLGSVSYLNEIKNAVGLPILRKDFIFEPYQVYESRWFGADAILLIVDLLPREKLANLIGIAESLGLDYLLEVHTEKDLKKALSLKAPLIGINNRDLHTLEVDFKTTEDLFTLIPKDKIVIVESGIKIPQDVLFLKVLGVAAVLIGQVFMESADIKRKVEEIMGW
ncbi:MAG: indole-3-glycerol phosphate synthase TrpC [Candidatus Omnitrophica bacterium]|nr:indole-3-glycerol phosphate synthase TrpC [Candidatus Omnitrophota bacterium]